MKNVGYCDDIPSEYVAALDAAATLDELIEIVREYDEVAMDAVEAAERMSESDFVEFRRALAKERKGRFSGKKAVKKYGAIFAPLKMLEVSIVADHFKVPWGTAFIRMKEMGKL